jgi:hypothetical protein
MKTIKLRSSILLSLVLFIFAFPWWNTLKAQPLTEVAKTYLGTYECKLAQLNNKNLLEDFSYINLELKKENECTIYAKPKQGKEKRVEGEYRYNEDRETITFYSDVYSFIKKEFPMKQGKIHIVLRQGDKTLIMQFEQK